VTPLVVWVPLPGAVESPELAVEVVLPVAVVPVVSPVPVWLLLAVELPVGGVTPWVVEVSPGGRLPLLDWVVVAQELERRHHAPNQTSCDSSCLLAISWMLSIVSNDAWHHSLARAAQAHLGDRLHPTANASSHATRWCAALFTKCLT
jgi:hypothetical protein